MTPRLRLSDDFRASESARIGFYGCSDAAGEGRVVRCAFVGEKRPPASATVDCPACGSRHRVAPFWRTPAERDADQEPDVVIEGKP